MTADRFGAIQSGEFTAVSAARHHDERAAGPPAADRESMGSELAGQVQAGQVQAGQVQAGQVLTGKTPVQVPTAQVQGQGVQQQGAQKQGAQKQGAQKRAVPAWWRPVLPPQHGAWAFLIVPVLCAFAISGASAAGWLFLGAWVAAYPVGYYLGRALTVRARRGSWTRLARRERDRAIPWVILTALLGLPLAITRPWLLGAATLLAVVWIAGLIVAAWRGERSLANDLLLVAQAGVALPLAVAVVAGLGEAMNGLRAPTLQATLIVTAYLAGSVLHVKSILREAGRPSFRRANVGWHSALAVLGGLANTWWLIGLVPALVRSLLLRPGMRPGAIGVVELVVAVLVVAAAFLAL